jgi:hypothetical protein
MPDDRRGARSQFNGVHVPDSEELDYTAGVLVNQVRKQIEKSEKPDAQ